MANEQQKAAEIDALIKKDAEEKEAAAKADAERGENIDKCLKMLDAMNKRLDAWEEKARKDAEEAAAREESDPTKVVADADGGGIDTDQPRSGAPMNDSVKRDACLSEQYAADRVYNSLGLGRSPAPVYGAKYRDYAIRLIDPLLKNSKAWKDIKADSLRAMDDAAFQVVKEQVYADSMTMFVLTKLAAWTMSSL